MESTRTILLAGVLVAVAGGGAFIAQDTPAPSLIEAPLAAQPTDVVVTPDGDFAVVRSTAPPPVSGNTSLDTDHLSVWDLQQRTRLSLLGLTTIPPPPPPGRGEFAPGSEVSDLVETTNSLTLCAGSALVGLVPTTFIDVLDLSQAAAGTAQVVASLERTGPIGAQMGDVNDVAITPNGRIGVVNHQNTVTFINMRQGTVRGEFNLAPIGVSPPVEVNPMGATDSIAVTNDRAVVITTRRMVTGQNFPWVFIFDLSSSPTFVTLRYFAPFIDPTLVGALVDFTSVARSVRITPDATQAVMTADIIVSAISLNAQPGNPQFPIGYFDPTDKDMRLYSTTRDSLEVTNTRAVTLANRRDPVTFLDGFRIRVFELTSGNFNTVTFRDTPIVNEDDRAHDVAITADALSALVKTEKSNVLVQSLNGSPSYVVIASTGDPLELSPFTPSLPSDSVVIAGTAPPFMGIVIGTRAISPNGFASGIVEFVSLPGGATVSLAEMDPSTTNPVDIRPMDLKLTQDGGRVWVRFEHAAGLPPGSGGQAAILYSIAGLRLADLAASGGIFRLDDIEIGSNAAISISESTIPPPGQVAGHVQLIHF